MDEALSWLKWLDRRTERIVWARAIGITWVTIVERDGRSKPTLAKVYRAALALIATRISQAPGKNSQKPLS
jgi:hypothetical protein